MAIRAIVFGATGMVGEGVLHIALNHPDVEAVLVVGRRSCEVQHPKLREIIHRDFYDFSSIAAQTAGYQACLFCLGVTSVGKNEAEYTRLTYDLTMAAAKCLLQQNPAMTFCYISGAGTDSTEKGKSMWARVKGKTENDLGKLGFKKVYNFRPGYIKPIPGLRHAFKVSILAGYIYPFLKMMFRNHVCTLEELGLSMVRVSVSGYEKNILECEDIERIGG